MGDWFGGYELEAKLGEGGMAEVFAAKRRGEDGFVRTVCIKRLLPHIEQDAAMAAAFGDEARIMAALHHPAIASVFEYGRHAGRSYLAMELVEGTDLRKVLRRTGPLPIELSIYVVHELATALAHAHAAHVDGIPQRVVHRDVTPSNVLLSVDGAVKLTDFGIAKATTRAHVTQQGIVKGKVPYMSPEQALGREIDQRTDLFALGVVLFECVAGRRPYDGACDLDTFRNAQSGVHESLESLVPGTPRALSDLAQALLRPRPEDRVASAADVVELLAQFPITLAARRALRDRVARCKAPPKREPQKPAPRPPDKLSIPIEISEPARHIPPARTRLARKTPAEALRSSITEMMSPTAIAESLAISSSFSPPGSPSDVLVAPRTSNPSRTSRAAPRERAHDPRRTVALSRNAIALIAVAWIALSTVLGGLAAQLLPYVPPVAVEASLAAN